MISNNHAIKIKVLGFILLTLISNQSLFAHTSIIDLEKMSKGATVLLYLRLGYQHILPFGIDHILFILSLFLLNPKLKPILWQATAFTIAHTITLGLSMYHFVKPASNIVEPLIALSILYVAMENIFSPKLKASRIGVVFIFGLIHGMGFASALSELGLPQNAYLSSLLMFNIGVELGQITIIIAAWFLLAKWFGNKPFYRKLIVLPVSMIISGIAAYWVVERLIF
jgi:hypothetical protein